MKLQTGNFSSHLENAAILSNQLVFQIYKPDNTSITVSTREELYSQYFTQAQDHLQILIEIAKT